MASIPVPNSLAAARAEIFAALQESPWLKGVKGFPDIVSEGDEVPYDSNGVLLPYYSVAFGRPRQAPARAAGIVHTGRDLRLWVFGIECYAATVEDKNNLAERIVAVLEGMEPTNCGPITEMNSGVISNPAEIKQNHTRLGIGMVFSAYAHTIQPNSL